jgi:hypothetical protein
VEHLTVAGSVNVARIGHIDRSNPGDSRNLLRSDTLPSAAVGLDFIAAGQVDRCYAFLAG